MRKSTISKIRQKIAVILIVLMSIESFSAVVGDSDGAAFVTKQEFEELKEDFEKQMVGYNDSLAQKIDGAIASYLAGLKVAGRSELPSILNKINQTFVDSTTLDWPDTRLGTYRKWYINLGALFCHIGYGGTLTQVQYLTGDINSAAWATENTGEYGIYLYGTKDDNVNVYRLQKYMYCYPYASVGGIFTSGSTWCTDPTNTITWPTKTFANDSSDAFGAVNDTWPLSVGGKNITVNVTKSFGIGNDIKDLTLSAVTGNKLSESAVHFVEAKNLNKPGDVDAAMKAAKMGYEIRGLSSTTGEAMSAAGWGAWDANSNTKINIYRHTYLQPTRLLMLNEKATTEFGQNVFYYEGLPLFTNDVGNGSVELKLKFTNTGSKRTVFQIQNKRFNNTALATTGYTTTYKVGNLMVADNNAEITINIENVKKDETYWIKARPIGANNMDYPTTIKTTKIILTTE